MHSNYNFSHFANLINLGCELQYTELQVLLMMVYSETHSVIKRRPCCRETEKANHTQKGCLVNIMPEYVLGLIWYTVFHTCTHTNPFSKLARAKEDTIISLPSICTISTLWVAKAKTHNGHVFSCRSECIK